MPYSKNEYPDSMKKLSPEVRDKAIEILNSLIEEGKMKKDIAIATAISKAKEWAGEQGSGSGNGNDKDLHVKSHDDGWAVEEEDNRKAKHVFDKKEYAVEKARELAKKNNVSLIIHKSDGKIQEKRSYEK